MGVLHPENKLRFRTLSIKQLYPQYLQNIRTLAKRSALPPKSDQDQVLQSCIVQSMCNLIWNLDENSDPLEKFIYLNAGDKKYNFHRAPTNIYPSNRTILSQLYHLSALVIQCSSWRTEGCRVKGLEERREKEEEREEKGFRVDNCVGATPVTL